MVVLLIILVLIVLSMFYSYSVVILKGLLIISLWREAAALAERSITAALAESLGAP